MAANSNRMIEERQAAEKGQRKPIMSDPSLLQNDLLAAAEALKYRPAEQPEAPLPLPQNRIVVVRPPTERKIAAPAMMTDEEREAARKYRDMKANALMSRSKVEGFQEAGEENNGQRQNFLSPTQLLGALGASNATEAGNAAALMQEGAQDVNAYRHKLDFLTQDGAERTPQGYSTNTRNAPLASMELKAGSVIPGLLLTGINSDLPGTVVGQVSENVWDTATGKFLLIPQGTRILGVYDSRITQGQKRVSVVWNRLVYPDGSSLNIAGSPGTDVGGYSGIKGKVDNHYGQLLNAVLFSSVFATLADVAAGDTSDNDKKSAKDVLLETTGVTIANVGARLAERALDIQPTIVIKPGSRFNVMVQQDVVFLQAWKFYEKRETAQRGSP
jgi:type IV secretion system protein VirB10